jgi:hypothetical protein
MTRDMTRETYPRTRAVAPRTARPAPVALSAPSWNGGETEEVPSSQPRCESAQFESRTRNERWRGY